MQLRHLPNCTLSTDRLPFYRNQRTQGASHMVVQAKG